MFTLVAIIALFFNIFIVIWKLRHPTRKLDGIIDGAILLSVFVFFSGSTQLLIIGTIGSMLVSIYLVFSPIRLSHGTA